MHGENSTATRDPISKNRTGVHTNAEHACGHGSAGIEVTLVLHTHLASVVSILLHASFEGGDLAVQLITFSIYQEGNAQAWNK